MSLSGEAREVRAAEAEEAEVNIEHV